MVWEPWIALEQAKLKDHVLVVSVDAIADALQAVKDGRLDATVFQDARGQAARPWKPPSRSSGSSRTKSRCSSRFNW